MTRRRALRALAATALAACAPRDRGRVEAGGPLRVVLQHQPFWGDPRTFRALLASFEAKHPGVSVITEVLPSASDVVHQYYLTALEGGAMDFDVLVVDVAWTAELARAGWIADLSAAFPPARMEAELLPAAAAAACYEGRTYAVPWYLDVGLLHRRADLCPEAPRTYDELVQAATRARAAGSAAHGYVWQGKQYEGLVCNAYEAIWGHGGATMEGARLALDTPEADAALGYLRALIAGGASPAAVTSMAEEESRRVFQGGGAVFMRNWPYAFVEAQRSSSPVRGKVAISSLPTLTGAPGAGTLGGWQLAVNARAPSERRDAAIALIDHLTSTASNVAMAIGYGRNPPRRAAYLDPRLAEGAPVTASLRPMLERARTRPITPYYPAIADALEAELSAAITGVRAPREALRRAQALADHLVQART